MITSTQPFLELHILGGGQLGQMLGAAALPLGVRCSFLDPSPTAPASLAGKLVVGPFKQATIAEFTKQSNYISFEFENIPHAELQDLSPQLNLCPSLKALKTSQDRLLEKEMFLALGIPTNKFKAVNNLEQLQQLLLTDLPAPAILKTRTSGYDGKGQARITRHSQDLVSLEPLVQQGALLEDLVSFDYELSCIGVFSEMQAVFYPVIKNEHRNGILIKSSPLLAHPLQQPAENYLKLIADHFNYKGVLTVEFFVKNNHLIANEIAPRVHNSGHWTIEGSSCSQFENHIRAIMGMPLGASTARTPYCTMWNILGTHPKIADILELPDTHLHLYHKTERQGRKLGHITICSDSSMTHTATNQLIAKILGH